LLGRALFARLLLLGRPSSTPEHPAFWFDPSGCGAPFGPAKLAPDAQSTAHTLHVLRGCQNVLAADELRIPKGTTAMLDARESSESIANTICHPMTAGKNRSNIVVESRRHCSEQDISFSRPRECTNQSGE
jgi:hypothetical protein